MVTGQQSYDLYYSLTNPQVKRVNSNFNGDYYLFENRSFTQSMVIGTTTVPDYNNQAFMPAAWSHGTQTQGIFVWKVLASSVEEYWTNGMIYASGRYGATWSEGTPSEGDDGDIFPGVANVTVLSPWSDPRPPYTGTPPFNMFVTNTKGGTNVGMEVLGQNSAGGYITVMLYSTNPEGASPSRPYGLDAGGNPGNNHVLLTWTANQEPDLASYEVWRDFHVHNPPGWLPIATVSTNSYVDDEFYYSHPNGLHGVNYKVRAKDATNKFSSFSDVVYRNLEPLEKAPPQEPVAFGLEQNYPNPFNPQTVIRYGLTNPEEVYLAVYDLLGKEVARLVNSHQEAGLHEVTFNASALASGTYVYKMRAGSFIAVKKLVVMK